MGVGAGRTVVGIILLAIRFHGEGGCPVIFFSGFVLPSIGVGVGLAGAAALGRNITPFPKPSGKDLLVKRSKSKGAILNGLALQGRWFYCLGEVVDFRRPHHQ